VVGELVGDHDEAVADLDLGVADGVGGIAGHAHPLDGAEHVDVEVDGRVRITATEVGGDARVAGGNRVDVGHGEPPENGQGGSYAGDRTYVRVTLARRRALHKWW
jgi:hypothetical protein